MVNIKEVDRNYVGTTQNRVSSDVRVRFPPLYL